MNHLLSLRGAPYAWSILALGALGLTFFAITSFTKYPLQACLIHYGVPAQTMIFGDLGVLAERMQPEPAAAGAEAEPFPYPSIWRLWRYFGLTTATVTGWGIGLAVAFVLAALLAVQPRTHGEGLFLAALLCSPVCLLLLERANGDALLFVALALGVVCVPNHWVNAPVILACGCAKLYPIAAAACFLVDHGRRAWWWMILVLAGLGAYIGLSWDQWQTVSALSVRVPVLSFGVAVPLQWIGVLTEQTIPYSRAYALGLVPVLAVIAGTIAWVRHARASAGWLDARAARGLVCGTGIVGAAFMMGSRFQYSFVFVLFCLPALFRGARDATAPVRDLCRGALLLLAVFSWWDAIIGEFMITSVLLKHLVCVALLALLLALSLLALLPRRAPTP